MRDYVTLLGAEDVKNASHRISEAADRMSSAAAQIHEAADRFILRLEDRASRLHADLDRLDALAERERGAS